jgi:heme oxygenase (biliverdin-IX-beta and delta-forming)
MAQVNKTQGDMPSKAELAADARALVRCALKASLASIAAANFYPYASLITVATEASGNPIFLISGLAQHTRNLIQDPRASILFDGTGAAGDPLQGGRVTLFGRAEKTDDEASKRRFLARHPEAAFYAGFPDFGFWRLVVEGAHYIGGFGRIVDLSPPELLIDTDSAGDLLAAEPGIVAHMNEDHADALRLYATRLAGAPEGFWRMSGIDPEGCDLMCEDDARDARRVRFSTLVSTPGEARKELVRLAEEAREPD